MQGLFGWKGGGGAQEPLSHSPSSLPLKYKSPDEKHFSRNKKKRARSIANPRMKKFMVRANASQKKKEREQVSLYKTHIKNPLRLKKPDKDDLHFILSQKANGGKKEAPLAFI